MSPFAIRAAATAAAAASAGAAVELRPVSGEEGFLGQTTFFWGLVISAAYFGLVAVFPPIARPMVWVRGIRERRREEENNWREETRRKERERRLREAQDLRQLAASINRCRVQSPWDDSELCCKLERFNDEYVVKLWREGPKKTAELSLLFRFTKPIEVVGQWIGEEDRGGENSGKRWEEGPETVWSGAHSYRVGDLGWDRAYKMRVRDLDAGDRTALELVEAIWIRGNQFPD